MKKVFPIIILALLITPILVFAGGTNCPTEGLVPCGTDNCPCDLCDLFLMFDNVLDKLLFTVVPVLAALMIVVGGAYYLISQGKPEVLSKAKSVFVSIVIGLLIVYGAWLLVNLFLMTLGVTVWDGPGEEWFKIECNSPIPSAGNNTTTPPASTPPATTPPMASQCSQCPDNNLSLCQRFLCMGLGDCDFTPGSATTPDLGTCSEKSGNNTTTPPVTTPPVTTPPVESFCLQCPDNGLSLCQRFVCMTLGDCVFTPASAATPDLGTCSAR